jgi:hypothetical protein
MYQSSHNYRQEVHRRAYENVETDNSLHNTVLCYQQWVIFQTSLKTAESLPWSIFINGEGSNN